MEVKLVKTSRNKETHLCSKTDHSVRKVDSLQGLVKNVMSRRSLLKGEKPTDFLQKEKRSKNFLIKTTPIMRLNSPKEVGRQLSIVR